MKFKFIDLFAGLGGFHTALEDIGGECVFAAEKNPKLNKLYVSNFPKLSKELIAHDITKINFDNIPDHDVLCAGFPCQPFSKAGKRKGMNDPKNGFLFDYILKLIDSRIYPPNYLLLENVPNILTLDKGKYWKKIKISLNRRGYEMDWAIYSPDDFGIPQNRKRVFLVASKSGLRNFSWPEKKKPELNLDSFINNNPNEIRGLSKDKEEILSIWSEFLNKLSPKFSLGFPIWATEFGATYPYDTHPLKIPINDLIRYKGKFGFDLQEENGLIKENLPAYVSDARKSFKNWKKNYIQKNRELYLENKNWIDGWKKNLYRFPHSLQKFEWNCQDQNRIITDKIVQFRPSGVRVKSKTNIPSLVAMNLTQIPYFPWKKRYMTVREGLAFQGLENLKNIHVSSAENYRAIGNAVNSIVVKNIAKNLILN